MKVELNVGQTGLGGSVGIGVDVLDDIDVQCEVRIGCGEERAIGFSKPLQADVVSISKRKMRYLKLLLCTLILISLRALYCYFQRPNSLELSSQG